MPRLKKLASLAVHALEDLKGIDIVVLNVSRLTSITDTMIICTGTSSRHVKSLAENVIHEAKKKHYQTIGIEGLSDSEWALVDLGDVIVHVMQQKARDFYGLEKRWKRSKDG